MIYIACPEKYATGGTELLHQFYYQLSQLTENVRIYYYNYSDSGDPTAKRFKKYEVDFVSEIEDSSNNILIVPEVATELLKDYDSLSKSIWWLSVDNHFIKYPDNLLKKIIKKMYRKITGKNEKKRVDYKNKRIIHLVQSEYANDFLKNKNVKNIEYLSDYLSDIYLKQTVEYNSENREDIVLYNPKKGYKFTKKIIEEAQKLKFLPIENLTQQGVINLCKRSKVYIDFGNHPGKDRLPRETAILGCTIITGKNGSAKFYEDVKINSKYKFENKEENIPKIINQIKNNIDNYDKEINRYEDYRKMILSEKGKFINDVKYIFKKHLFKYV